MKSNNRNVSIQLIRITAMLMIVMDHLFAHMVFPYKSVIVQITNSGVLIFLLISGYLFGQKEITNWKEWFINRLLKICIPIWVFMVIDLIVEQILFHNFSIKYVFIYLFNVQGFFEGTRGGTPLWFVSLIGICYLITPLLYKLKKINISKTIIACVTIAIVILQIVSAYTTDIGMVYGHSISWCILAIGIYAVGFYAGGKLFDARHRAKKTIVLTVCMIAATLAIIILHKQIDNTVLYNEILLWYGIIIVDIWISLIIYQIGCLEWVNHCRGIINFIDGISYEFYIVHYLIMISITLPLGSKVGTFYYILITIILSTIGGAVLHYICKPIISSIKRAIEG